MTSSPRSRFPGLLAAVLVAAGVAIGAGAAQAVPTLTPRVVQIEPRPLPSVPEPSAAIVFGLGMGLVAWQSRRARPPV